ncbi:SPOR domain-containing protein [Paenibacillus yanchengensis]|uniref:SPOR domain-containing protein n=1 Tax=Paenibacillus yanchengensis TaxID=2035833 RepID=A0ABW4YLC5_9BACL
MYSDTNMNRRFTIRFDGSGKVVRTSEESVETAESIKNNEEIVDVDRQAIIVDEEKMKDEFSERIEQISATEKMTEKWEHVILDNPDPWHSPFQEDVGALEKLIRNERPERPELAERLERSDRPERLEVSERVERQQNKRPSVVEKKQDNDMKEIDLSEVEQIEVEVAPLLEAQYRRTKKTSAWQVVLYVAGALTTGAVFGYIILTLITNGFLSSDNNASMISQRNGEASNMEQGVSGTSAGVGVGEGINQLGKATNGTIAKAEPGAVTDLINNAEVVPAVSLAGHAQTYYMLQYGVFSKLDSRDAALEQLTAKGIAASTAKADDQYRVYAGMAASAADAKLIAEKYPSLNLYVKELVIKTPQALPFTGNAEIAEQFFSSTASLVTTWSDLIAVQLEQASLTPFAETTTESLTEQFNQWKALSTQMNEGMKDEQGNKFLGFITTAVRDAAKALDQYNDQVAMKYLQTAQQAMMTAVLAQNDWFDHLSAL